MEPIVNAIVTFIDRADIDTDAILPKQYMRSIEKNRYGQFLFDGWRYLELGDLGRGDQHRHLNQEFVPNQQRIKVQAFFFAAATSVPVPHASMRFWALHEYGLRILIAPSYGDIFANNCLKNDVLPIVLPEDVVECLFNKVESTPGYQLTVRCWIAGSQDSGRRGIALCAGRFS